MSDHMQEFWTELPTELRSMVEQFPERSWRHGGLQLCEVMDFESGTTASDFFIIALENTGETLLVLLCDEARAIEIATDMAGRRDWTTLADWSGYELLPEQVAIITAYPGQATPPLTRDGFDWDEDVPYGA